MKKLFLIFLFLLIACPAWGATKTVCASGCDYTTLTAAEAGASTGDTVHIAAGTYIENDANLHCWYTTKGISWIADGEVIVKANSNVNYVLVHAGTTAVASWSGITFDANNTSRDSVYIANGSNKTFTDCSFVNAVTQGVNLSGTGGANVFVRPSFSGAPTLAAVKIGQYTSTSISDISVSDFTSEKIISTATNTGNVTVIGGTITASLSGYVVDYAGTGDVTVSGLTATLSPNVTNPKGIFNASTAGKTGNITISQNNVDYEVAASTSVVNVSDGTHEVLISDNFIISDDENAYTTINIVNQPLVSVINNTIDSGAAGSIFVQSTGVVGIVNISKNNITSTKTSDQIILVGTDSSSAGNNKLDNATIAWNRISLPVGHSTVHAIEYGYNKNATIKHNYIYGGAYGIVVKGVADEYTTGGVFYNILKDQHIEQLRLKGTKNCKVYNNTFYLSSGLTIDQASIHITVNTESSNTPTTGTILKNNIIYTQSGQNALLFEQDPATTGLTIDHNISYPLRSVVNGTTFTSLNDWQAAGYDAHGLNADPLFISATNFHLQAGSPARGAGVDVGLSNTNPPDIGAEPYKQYVPWVR